MRPRARCNSRQGLLLVEATLAAVVMVSGLVVISRGLSSQLRALRSVEARETLRHLATSRLLELEGLMVSRHPLPPDQAGNFDPPFQRYRWMVRAAAREDLLDPDGHPTLCEVHLIVQAGVGSASSLRLSALWPVDRVPPEWF